MTAMIATIVDTVASAYIIPAESVMMSRSRKSTGVVHMKFTRLKVPFVVQGQGLLFKRWQSLAAERDHGINVTMGSQMVSDDSMMIVSGSCALPCACMQDEACMEGFVSASALFSLQST